MVTSYLALDVGTVRIGVARANSLARIAEPLQALAQDDTTIDALTVLTQQHDIAVLVVGWPRNLSGEQTSQTAYVADFIDELSVLGLPIHRQDEAVTSIRAKDELESRGKPYAKGDIDSLSAVYILEDYLNESVH